MRQTLRKALYGRLGSVVRGVTPVKHRLVQGLPTEFPIRCLRRIRDALLGSRVDND